MMSIRAESKSARQRCDPSGRSKRSQTRVGIAGESLRRAFMRCRRRGRIPPKESEGDKVETVQFADCGHRTKTSSNPMWSIRRGGGISFTCADRGGPGSVGRRQPVAGGEDGSGAEQSVCSRTGTGAGGWLGPPGGSRTGTGATETNRSRAGTRTWDKKAGTAGVPAFI